MVRFKPMKRAKLAADLGKALKRSRVVAHVGPRQSSKTTLLQTVVSKNSALIWPTQNRVSVLDIPLDMQSQGSRIKRFRNMYT